MGRLHRAAALTARQVLSRLRRVAVAPVQRHDFAPLLAGAWKLRHDLRLVDALYIQLTGELDAPLVTTDARLAAASSVADLVAVS